MKRALFIGFVLSVLLISFVAAVSHDSVQTQQLAAQQTPQTQEQIALPENIQEIVKFIFNLDTGAEIEFSFFIILVALLLIFFFLVIPILELIPFFEEKWKALVGAIVITLIISTSGFIETLARYMTSLGAGIQKFNILILAIFAFLIYLIISKLAKIIKHEIKRAK